MKPQEFICGVCRVCVPESDTLKLLNVLLKSGIVYRGFATADGQTVISVTHRAAERLKILCGAADIGLTVSSVGGIPHLWRRLRGRWGLWAGLAAAILLLWAGNSVIWEVHINGNERMSEREVCELLAGYGVAPGMPLRSLDVDYIQTCVERDSPDVAWLSINMVGVVAEVELREEEKPSGRVTEEGDGVNLVAARDGVIIAYEISTGEPVPPAGSAVKEGELLVSGLIDSGRLGWRVRRAAGRVLARTVHTLSVSVPYEYTQRTANEDEIIGISLVFFSYRQKIFKKSGIEAGSCDTINSVYYVYSNEEHTIPVGLELERRLHITQTPCTRSRDEAQALAVFELNRLIAAECEGARLVRKTVNTGFDDTGCTLDCELILIEDIARQSPFYVIPQAQTTE